MQIIFVQTIQKLEFINELINYQSSPDFCQSKWNVSLPWYLFIFKISILIFPIFFKPHFQYPPQDSRTTNLFRLFDGFGWALIFLTWLTIYYTFKLLEFVAGKMGYISLETPIPFFPFRLFFFYALFVFIRISLFRVNVPMGGTAEVYTDLEQRRMFSYANVRKAAYRGWKTNINHSFNLPINIYSIQVLCDWRNIPSLVCWLHALFNDDQDQFCKTYWHPAGHGRERYNFRYNNNI